MKKIIYFIIAFSVIAFPSYAQQKYPKEIQIILDRLKNTAENNLLNYRWDNSGWFCFELRPQFTFFREAENYNLNIGMLYDEDMRNRMVKLLKGEIEPYEMDTIEILCKTKYTYDGLKRWAFYEAKIDTIYFFQTELKKLYENLEKENKVEMHKKLNNIYDIELFEQLKLDTISEYQKIYQDMVKSAYSRNFENKLKYYKSKDHSEIAKLSGYINDKRFIKPLIATLDEPERFKREVVLEALARMKVEPYYSQYFKERTRSLDEIKKERPDFPIEELVEVIRTQESFLELSKYLLSDVPYNITIGEFTTYYSIISGDACCFIRDNIENEELQKMIPEYDACQDENVRRKVYDWMQKNYGKYEIKRVW